MSNDVLFLLLGLALSIPLSIAANLVTGRLERWWGRRSERKAAELERRDAEFRKLIHGLGADAAAYQAYLWNAGFRAIRGVLSILLLLASLVIATGALLTTYAESTNQPLRAVIGVAFAVTAILLGVTHFRTVELIYDARRVIRQVEAHRESRRSGSPD